MNLTQASYKDIAIGFIKSRHSVRLLIIFCLLGLLLGPFLLRPSETALPDAAARRKLVILTPHNQHVRDELGQAFVREWKNKTGEDIFIDWRIPGGASEIMLYLKSEYAHALEVSLKSKNLANEGEATPGFNPSGKDRQSPLRSRLMESEVGIGIDLLFGGGGYEFSQLAKSGYFVAGDAIAGTGLQGIRKRHPDWFENDVFPERFGGEVYRDHDDLWAGVVLAGFGILSNRDSLARLGIHQPPAEWSDLGKPEFLGQLGLADPSKSGSVAKAFELIIQQAIQSALADRNVQGDPLAEQNALEQGWKEGFRLIQRLAANARYFTDSASKIALEVSRGDAAAGMAIDTYGRTTEDYVRDKGGYSRIAFRVPRHGSVLSADPVAMLRGAPHPDLATGFMNFLLSPSGQALWGLRPGAPGGPGHWALRRLPIRMDFYRQAHVLDRSDPDDDPYRDGGGFVYHPEWTAALFPVIRFLIRNVFVEAHSELQAAYSALKLASMPGDAVALFDDLDAMGLSASRHKILPILKSRDRISQVRLSRQLLEEARARYRRVIELTRLKAR